MNSATRGESSSAGAVREADDTVLPTEVVEQRNPASAGAEAEAGEREGAGAEGVRKGGVYGREEVSALKGIFNLYDAESTGTIGIQELEGILQKVGHNPGT